MSNELIIQTLITRDDFCRTITPFLKDIYFEEESDKIIYKSISEYFDKYNSLPSKDALKFQCEEVDCSEETINEVIQKIEYAHSNKINDPLEFLFEKTENYCQDRALYLALMETIEIVEGEDESRDMKSISKHAIPDLLREALGVSFDEKIGHDYVENWESRYEFYNEKENRLPFKIKFLDEITKSGNGISGLPSKTLTIFSGGAGAGKSLALCHCATSYLKQGKNVLYITLEMSEEMISQRIDTNLMDITSDALYKMSFDQYKAKVESVQKKTAGKLIVKEYPTGGAHAGHFRHLLSELKVKKSFNCDVILIDYLGICASSRVKNSSANSYTIQKSIAEELRALAIEWEVPLLTGAQLNRGGIGSTDVTMTDLADSMGLAHTADVLIGLITDDTLRENNQLIVKGLKNRFGEVGTSAAVGVDYQKMRLYDIESGSLASVPPQSTDTSTKTADRFSKLKGLQF